MFRVAHEFKLDPRAVMAWPHRLLQEALSWLEDQWQEPTKLEWHLLQIANEIYRTTLTPGARNSSKPHHFKLTFKTQRAPVHNPASSPPTVTPQRKAATKEDIIRANKARWMMVTGMIKPSQED